MSLSSVSYCRIFFCLIFNLIHRHVIRALIISVYAPSAYILLQVSPGAQAGTWRCTCTVFHSSGAQTTCVHVQYIREQQIRNQASFSWNLVHSSMHIDKLAVLYVLIFPNMVIQCVCRKQKTKESLLPSLLTLASSHMHIVW